MTTHNITLHHDFEPRIDEDARVELDLPTSVWDMNACDKVIITAPDGTWLGQILDTDAPYGLVWVELT